MLTILINYVMRKRIVNFIEDFGSFWRFAWFVLLAPVITGRTRPMPGRNHLWAQMFEIGIKSVPVVMITGAFVAMTLAVQSYGQLYGMGFEDRMGSLINLSVVKELGPVLAAFMLAGRVGGALTAELGTMRVTEQIDAVRSIGANPLRYLVWPRFMACVLLMPFLTIYADLMGVIGGYVISVFYYKINSEAYWRFSADIVQLWDVGVGVAKSFFFGASISLISCFKGFHCDRGARGVGKACTEAFVYSFIAILLLNFVLAVITKAIYETLWDVQIIV